MQGEQERKTILLVDDLDFFIDTTKEFLKDKYEVITARSGMEAIGALVDGLIPNLILLDIVMPDMDGWITYRRLKELCEGYNVPIAFVTSQYGDAEVKHAYEAGVADYIRKPIQKTDFLERVEKLLSLKGEEK